MCNFKFSSSNIKNIKRNHFWQLKSMISFVNWNSNEWILNKTGNSVRHSSLPYFICSVAIGGCWMGTVLDSWRATMHCSLKNMQHILDPHILLSSSFNSCQAQFQELYLYYFYFFLINDLMHILHSSFYRWGNWKLDKCNNLAKII